MRVSSNNAFLVFSRGLRMRQEDLIRTQEQIVTQKRINRPSDDPVGARRVLTIHQELEQFTQFDRNMARLRGIYTATETALSQANDLLQRVKDLAIQGTNGTLTAEARSHIADEIQQLSLQLLDVSNTKLEGNYLFSGYKVTTQPFTLGVGHPNVTPAATFAGDTNIMEIEISLGINLEANIDGEAIFLGDGTAQTADLFQILADTEVALRTGAILTTDPNGVPDQLDKLDIARNQLLSGIAQIGARDARLEAMMSSAQDLKLQRQELKMAIEDAPFEETVSNFARAKMALEATIGASTQMLQLPSVFDFIR